MSRKLESRTYYKSKNVFIIASLKAGTDSSDSQKVALFKAGAAGRSNGLELVKPLSGSFYFNLHVLWPAVGIEYSKLTPVTHSWAIPQQIISNPATPPLTAKWE